MKKIIFKNLESLLNNKYKAVEIDKKKFVELLMGDMAEEDTNIDELTEGCISETNESAVKYYLINDVDVLNSNCKCIPSGFTNIDQYFGYTVFPYILVALGLSTDLKLVNEYYVMSSFEHNIFNEMEKL